MTITLKQNSKNNERPLTARIDNRGTAATLLEEWAANPASIGLTKNVVSNAKVNAVCFAFDGMGDKYAMCNVVSGKYYKNSLGVLSQMTAIVNAINADSTLTGKHAFDTSGESEGAEDDTISTFSVDFSCEIASQNDAFHHVFQNKKAILRGYSQVSTLNKIEAWADTKAVLA